VSSGVSRSPYPDGPYRIEDLTWGGTLMSSGLAFGSSRMLNIAMVTSCNPTVVLGRQDFARRAGTAPAIMSASPGNPSKKPELRRVIITEARRRCVSEGRWAEPSTLRLWGSFLEPTALFREPGALSGPADSDGREDDHKRDDDGV
jgi:hypothetical protein